MNIDIPFNNNWKSIAVSLSGGADSALMTYLLCNTIETNNLEIDVHVISHIRLWKTRPWQQYDSIRVYEWLTNRFSTIKFYRHTNFIPPELEHGYRNSVSVTDEYGKVVSGDTLELRSFAEFICIHNNIDAYFNGVTKNPVGKDFGGLPARTIELTETNAHLYKTVHMGVDVLHPFRFTDKRQIVAEYIKLELMDLFNITRSCEGEFSGLDYTNYVIGQVVPTCGECFWCKERRWAIENAV